MPCCLLSSILSSHEGEYPYTLQHYFHTNAHSAYLLLCTIVLGTCVLHTTHCPLMSDAHHHYVGTGSPNPPNPQMKRRFGGLGDFFWWFGYLGEFPVSGDTHYTLPAYLHTILCCISTTTYMLLLLLTYYTSLCSVCWHTL